MATDLVDGVPDAVIDGKNGLLVPAGDYDKMAESIQSLLEDPQRLGEFKKEVANFTSSQYSNAKIYGEYKMLFARLLENKI